MKFEDLNLSPPLLKAVHAAGYHKPTPIQASAIPHILAGRDVLGSAQTGTGKTAAFALPILQILSQRLGEQTPAADHEPVPGESPRRGSKPHSRAEPRTRGKHVQTESPRHASRRTAHGDEPGRQRHHPAQSDGESRGHSHGAATEHHHADDRRKKAIVPSKIRCLVLAPTRELAHQIDDSFKTYGKHSGLRTTVIYGGVGQGPQTRALRAGVDILVATPGRLLDLMQQGWVSLTGIEVFVLDEADRMLDMGFLPDLRRILAKLPRRRQTLFFSATMPDSIRALADDILTDAVPVHVARVSSVVPTVSHEVYFVGQAQKLPLLTKLLNTLEITRALVFTRTKRGAETLTSRLESAGVRAAALHGNKSQGERTRALEDFKSADAPVLVATDIAARGLDIDDISHVINYDLTAEPETYVHRIGRTGRAGASGHAISFCTVEDHGNLRAIEKLIHMPLERKNIPGTTTEPRHAHGPSHAHGHGHAKSKEVEAVEPAPPPAKSSLYQPSGFTRRAHGRRFARGVRPGMRVP